MSKKLSQVSVALMFSPPVINGKFQCLLLKKPLKHSEKESKYFFLLPSSSSSFFTSKVGRLMVWKVLKVTAVDIDLICLLLLLPPSTNTDRSL